MDTKQWQKIDSLFDEYLDASPEVQSSFLDRKSLDTEIRHELNKLISALGKSESFIESPNFTQVKELFDEKVDGLIGKKVGSYKLERLLGKGGNGAVYFATRIDDFSKEVAIKLIPTFFNPKSTIENFRRERQILARLEHENIARILDGGTTEDGTPFLVMEYVDGLPLDEYCEKENFTTNQRLELFLQVCDAVTFAHQNLIVHRDLKPNNILVKKEGKVKLLDFGIAKILHREEIDFSNNQTLNGNAFTPEYASSEQINGSVITTASDVYSLGVVLYELLTGNRPHSFKEKSLQEILKIITFEEPRFPSAFNDSKPKEQKVKSELDSIVMKSLAKNPRERYQTANELRDDIFNYLNSLPISAASLTTFYRIKKYFFRHKISLAIVAGILFILLGWLGTAIHNTLNIARQARENRRSAYSAEMILAATEYENSNLNRVNELVQKYDPKKGVEDLRGFEWYFLKNLLNPTTKINSFLHPDEVWNTEFSPDGKLLATVANDNITRIWSVETISIIAQTVEQKGAWKCSFYPDGKKFAVSSSSQANPVVVIYDTEKGTEVLRLVGHTKRVRAVDVSPDGTIIATGSQDGTVKIWDAVTGQELRKIQFATQDKGTEILDVQFSKSGKKLVIGGFEVVAMLDTENWQLKKATIAEFIEKGINLNTWKVILSPLEKTIAVGNWTGEVFLINAEKLNIIKILPLHQANVKSLAFSQDGKILATASWDRTVKFVDVQTGETVNKLKGHFAGVHEIAYSPDGSKIATASADFLVNLWNAQEVVSDNSLLTKASILKILPETNSLISWNNENNEINSWNFNSRQKNWFEKIQVNAFTLDISIAKSLIVMGERDGFVSIFDLKNSKLLKRFQISPNSIYAIKFSLDGSKIFSLNEKGLFLVLETDSTKLIYENQLHSTITKSLEISPDGKFVASGSDDKTVKLLNAETYQERFVFKDALKPLYKIAFSPDNKYLATTGADDYVRIYRISDGALIHELTGMSAGVFALTYSPDGTRLATSSDVGVIRLWNAETGQQVLAFRASQKQINNLGFIENGQTLVSADIAGKVSFWQTK